MQAPYNPENNSLLVLKIFSSSCLVLIELVVCWPVGHLSPAPTTHVRPSMGLGIKHLE